MEEDVGEARGTLGRERRRREKKEEAGRVRRTWGGGARRKSRGRVGRREGKGEVASERKMSKRKGVIREEEEVMGGGEGDVLGEARTIS